MYNSGRIGIGALGTSQFTNIKVDMDQDNFDKILEQRNNYNLELENERKKYPGVKLWKTIDFKNFGAGRQIRFGHLTGTDEMFIVIAQNQQRIYTDRFGQISCLTAINLDGEILWQIGEPKLENAHLTADLPLQVYDIDGDGKDEVIMSKDFKLMILDGETGKVKKWVHTPRITEGNKYLKSSVSFEEYPFDRLNVDAIRICNFRGKDKPQDILIKSRYKKVFTYDNQLNLMWSYDSTSNSGHFPYTKDINGDGKEEMYMGYDLVSAEGERIWSLPISSDHTDEIVIGKIDPDREDIIAIVSGSEGFMLADLQGNIISRHIIGHAQRISVGNYIPELPGLQICITTFWFHQGIIMMYDCKGNLIWSKEPSTNGNVITPVNWKGDGQDLILLNGDIEKGGLIDGQGRQVVRFPDDGHPELCAEVLDLTGDCRDEIVLWDEHKMYIYTQDNEFKGEKIYCPHKYPHYNASNYRGEYSYPNSK
jgi:hypothetical protein